MEKIALVTGASRGIGAATALALAKRGWTVHVNYLKSREKAEAVAAQTGGIAVQADVADARQVKAMYEKTGPVELLVNNAGIALRSGLLTDVTDDKWQRLFDVNVTGMFHCCRTYIPDMVRRKRGQILSLASVLGTMGGSCEAPYSATKGAVIAMTKALAKELGPSGIRVNAVAPGMIDTDTFSRGTTARSVSLSWGAREVGSPCEWRGGARHCSRVMVGESGLETC